jgi:hypothetical protein
MKGQQGSENGFDFLLATDRSVWYFDKEGLLFSQAMASS